MDVAAASGAPQFVRPPALSGADVAQRLAALRRLQSEGAPRLRALRRVARADSCAARPMATSIPSFSVFYSFDHGSPIRGNYWCSANLCFHSNISKRL